MAEDGWTRGADREGGAAGGSEAEFHSVVVVGAGPSGIAAAVRLLQAGERDFVLLEKADRVGGAWRENTYPGCACDVPSALYSFSFAPNPGWTRAFAEQPEILEYLERVARDKGVLPHVRFGAEVLSARYREADQRWVLETPRGTFEARMVLSAAGPLHEPRVPALEGLGDFQGKAFHSARWEHDYDLRGKRVAVVGTGASAIQFLPKIQPLVKELHVFQRTAPWVLPKPDHFVPEGERALFRRVPLAQRALRSAEYGLFELFAVGFRNPSGLRALGRLASRYLEGAVADPALRAKLTPQFTLGCKRVLLSNSYYPALCQPNVTVHHTAVERVGPRTVHGADGSVAEVDALIFGTGFVVTDPPIAERVFGVGGQRLAERWAGSPEAYVGTTVHGYPNFFLVIGPNLGTGHSSAMMIIEAQLDYILGALAASKRHGGATLEVRADAQARFNAEVQRALATTVYNAGGCTSYYLDRNGRNSSTWPWSTGRMLEALGRFDESAYEVRPAPERRPVVAITGGARGIGRATAGLFAQRGYTVAVGDLDVPEEPRAQQRFYRLDVRSPESWAAFVRAVERDLGPVEVLVNNAGIMPVRALLEEEDATTRATLEVNLLGPVYGMRAVLPGMRARGRGAVVNVASLAGKVPIPGLATYCASKFGLLGLTRSVREELAGTGVTAGCVLPAAVSTELLQGLPLGGGLPLVSPEEVARAIFESARSGRAELSVPSWPALYEPVAALVPERVLAWARAALRADRLLAAAGRRETPYEQRIASRKEPAAPG